MLDWAAAEGWNPGLDDAEPFLATDPDGFFVAEVGGEIAAAISVVNHSADMAFLGFFICRPDLRGRGIGSALWRHALAHAESRCVGLDGVAAQEANYASHGFVRAGASRRFSGVLPARMSPDIRPARPDDRALLHSLDRDACGYERPAFLNAWTAPGPHRRTVITEAGDGFATIRLCRSGCKIGPIVAPSPDEALRLASAAAALLPATPAQIDVAPGAPLAATLAAAGFEETFATARMYRGAAPSPGPGQMAIASMELG